jgi:hypothetical protein
MARLGRLISSDKHTVWVVKADVGKEMRNGKRGNPFQ